MRRLFVIVVSVVAAGTAGVLPARASADGVVDRIHQLRAAGTVTLTEDGRAIASDLVGDEVVVDLAGKVIERLPFRAKAVTDAIRPLGIPGAACVHDNGKPGFTPYLPPADYPINKKNEKGGFKFHFYSQDQARHDHWGSPTVQFLVCGVGGVDGQNGSRIRVSGPGIAFNDANGSNIIGTRWKEGKTPEDYSITLGFEVPVRGVTVKGSIQQDPSNYLKGSVLPPYKWDDSPSGTRGMRWPVAGQRCPTWSTIAATRSAADMGTGAIEGRVTAVLRTLATAAAVTLAVSGCSPRMSREEGSKIVRPSELVAIEGPAPVGRFYAKAGDNSLDADLYEFSFSPPGQRRITNQARVSTVDGCPSTVVVSAAQKEVGLTDHLQRVDGSGLAPLEGIGTVAGSDPHVSPDCRILYLRVAEGAGGQLVNEIVLVEPSTGNSTTVATGSTVATASWGPDGEIVILRRETDGPLLVVQNPDKSHAEIRRTSPTSATSCGAVAGGWQWGWLSFDNRRRARSSSTPPPANGRSWTAGCRSPGRRTGGSCSSPKRPEARPSPSSTSPTSPRPATSACRRSAPCGTPSGSRRPDPMSMRTKLLLPTVAVALAVGAWVWWLQGGLGGPVSDEAARRYFDRVVGAAQAKDFEALCGLNGSAGTCRQELRVYCPDSFGSGPSPQFPKADDLEHECRESVPPDPPTIVSSRYQPSEHGYTGGRILLVRGVDGRGKAYETERPDLPGQALVQGDPRRLLVRRQVRRADHAGRRGAVPTGLPIGSPTKGEPPDGSRQAGRGPGAAVVPAL